jgi:hypothetical protein
MPASTDLIRWDVPFAEAKYPSVSIITEKGGIIVTLVVAPGRIDPYPKYLVRFECVIALLCYEEAFAFERGYRALTRSEENLCAYKWIGSPWLDAYRKGEAFVMQGGKGPLEHYLVFGGDSIVELVVSEEPKIERLDEKATIVTKHEA